MQRPKFNRLTFEGTANAIKRIPRIVHKDSAQDSARFDALHDVAASLADFFCESVTEKFDRERFIRDCGFQE